MTWSVNVVWGTSVWTFGMWQEMQPVDEFTGQAVRGGSVEAAPGAWHFRHFTS
jgi:hypothetical protein